MAEAVAAVANEKAQGIRNKAKQNISVIYMTWGENMDETDYRKPGIEDIRDVAEEIHREGGGFVTRQQLAHGLMTMKRKINRERLRWNRP